MEHIGRSDPGLNTLTVVQTKEALAKVNRFDAELASEAKGRKASGTDPRPTVDTGRLLMGVSTTVKEEFDVVGLPTILDGSGNPSSAAADNEVIHRVYAAGVIVAGKMTMPEFGHYSETISDRYGAILNPQRRDFSPGGSSGGSAMTVAVGMTPITLGADGGGSIHLPAACYGILGPKPERNRVTMIPLSQHWHALITFSGLSRMAVDSALLYNIIVSSLPSGRQQAGPLNEPYRDAVARRTGLLWIARIGRSPMLGLENDPEVDRALTALIQRLAYLGRDVRETHAAWPVPTDAFILQFFSDMATEADSVEAPEKLERHARRIAAVGHLIPTHLARFVERRSEKIARIFNECFLPTTDVLAVPTVPVLPWPLGWLESRSTFVSILRGTPMVVNTSIPNMTGYPALPVPGGVNAEGLSIGMQLVTRPGREGLLLTPAAQFEEDEPWPTPSGF